MPAAESSDQITRRAGRGFAFILGAKVYFLFAGYVIVFGLAWALDRALYGVYGLVVGAISVLDNVIVTGTIQTVSRFTAHDEGAAGAIKATALKIQLLFGGGVALTFALCAPWIAAFERDPSLTPYLRLAAGIVFAYAFYSVFVGSANGLRRFGIQAGLDALYATLRGALIVGLAAAGFAVWGAVGGFVIASFVILLISAAVLGVRDLRGGYSPRPLVRFALPVMAYLLLINLAMFVDLFLLKRIATEILEAGNSGVEAVNEVAGSYVAVQQLARITYQALLAVTFVVFPLISRSTFEQDRAATGRYVATTLRYSLVFAGLVAVSFVALPAQVLAVPFRPEYQIGAAALVVLALAYLAYSMQVVGTTILNAAGRPRLAVAVAAVSLVVEVGACWLLLARAQSVGGMLMAAAGGAAVGMGLGWLLVSLALRRELGASTPALTMLRVALAFGAASAVGRFLPQGSRLLTLAECLVVVLVYGLALLATRELGREDLRRALAIVRRR